MTESCVDITQRLRGSNILSLETFGIHVVDDLGPINSKDVITNRAVSVLCIQNVDDPSTKGGSELPLRTQTHTHTHTICRTQTTIQPSNRLFPPGRGTGIRSGAPGLYQDSRQ